MCTNRRNNTYATLVNREGRFVDTLGRVVDDGAMLVVADGSSVDFYHKEYLLDVVSKNGFDLVFLPPTVRLPAAPLQVSHAFYEGLSKAKISTHFHAAPILRTEPEVPYQ